MDNIFNNKGFNRINIQLELLEKKKKSIFKELYCAYEIYLSGIRSQLFNSISKGIFALSELTQTKGRIYKDNISSLLNKEIKLLNDQLLPFLTIEQLSTLDEIYYELNNNSLRDSNNIKFTDENDIISELSKEEINNQGKYYYYDGNNRRNNLMNSVDLDNNNYNYENFIGIDTTLIETNEEKKLIITSNDLDNNKNNFNNKKLTFNTLNIFEEKQLLRILEWSDLIDNGLNYQLKNFSIEVNNLYFNKMYTKENIPDNFISYLFENNFLTTNPKPFITKLDLLSNEFILNDQILKNLNFSNIFLFCINQTELEFNNIKLNIQRNKIINLKNLLKTLIKKEKYWSSKKQFSNYD